MRDDEDEASRRVHTVDTVPPPAGEDDVYGAKTQIGGLTPEALAMLRQVRDERPQTASTLDDLDVSVFEEDGGARNDGPAPVARMVPAAGRPAAAKPLDVTPEAREVAPPVAPVFAIPRAPLAPRELAPLLDDDDDDEPDPEPEPASYVSVFAPLSGEGPGPETQPSARRQKVLRSRALIIVAALVVLGVALALVTQAGRLYVSHPADAAPVVAPEPSP
jgi:hypothetical protein